MTDNRNTNAEDAVPNSGNRVRAAGGPNRCTSHDNAGMPDGTTRYWRGITLLNGRQTGLRILFVDYEAVPELQGEMLRLAIQDEITSIDFRTPRYRYQPRNLQTSQNISGGQSRPLYSDGYLRTSYMHSSWTSIPMNAGAR